VSLYATLGIQRDATPAQIKRAYQVLASKWHPDRNQAPDAQEQFVRVQKVYDVLSDPDAREHYDRTGMAPPTGLESVARSMVLQHFMQIAQRRQWKPWPYVRDIRSTLKMEMSKAQDAVRDAEQSIERLPTILPSTDGENIFEIAISDARAKLQDTRERAAGAIHRIEAALQLLEGYTDTAEEPASMTRLFVSTTSSA